MGDKNFLLSIIIPTKNRQKFAYKAVEQILQLNDGSIQVVIQDNSDDSSLKSMISKFNDNIHIKYNYTEGVISFVDNFNLAVGLADGEYVCIIGDDDGILPQILEVTKWAKENNIDAIKPGQNVVYFWPESNALGTNQSDNGNLYIHKITSESKVCNPYLEVVKLLNQGGQKYLTLDLVKLYHGVVKKSCLDNIKNITGQYFAGLTPDIYMSVALSLTITKVVKLNFPLTISGICNTSGSADSATGKHTGELKDAPHFRGHSEYDWSKYVPEFYSVETIWADSALAAVKSLDETELYKKFNLGALSVYCLKNHPEYKNIILKHLKGSRGNKSVKTFILLNYLKYPFMDLIRKVLKKVTRKKNDSLHLENVIDIINAQKHIEDRLGKLHVNTDEMILSLNNSIKSGL